MAEPERSPLLAVPGRTDAAAPHEDTDSSHESTPLLSGADSTARYDGENRQSLNGDAASARSGASSRRSTKKRSRRWPSIIAMIILAILCITVIVLAFFVPAAVEEYAKEAAVLEPTNLSLESITSSGVRARIRANVRLDGSRVKNEHVRRVGRATTWLVRQLGTEETKVSVYLPEYDQLLLGSAVLPPLVIDLVDGHNTAVDFVADLQPGDADGIRMIANEWLEGRLKELRLQGKADIALKSGLIPLGTHAISESLTFEANKIPTLPKYNITRLNVQEAPIPGENKQGMAAEISIKSFNEHPISVQVPELGFDILVPGCSISDPYILVADAITQPVDVRPNSDVVLNARGLVREIPRALTSVCPNSDSSPLDVFLKQFLNGKEATVFVRGAKKGNTDTPDWLSQILSSVTLPVPFPGRSFDNLIREFSLTNVHFALPDPMAPPDDPNSNPQVSGTIQVLAKLPSEMNFEINVTNVRADADVFYEAKKLGELNISRWQKANSTKLDSKKGGDAMLKIQSKIKNAPLNVTDSNVLTDVIQTLLFGGETVVLDVKAAVDVKVDTILGRLTLKDVPAEGKIPVKPMPRNTLTGLKPKINNISILETTPSSIKLEALVNITNPTPYTARIPFVAIHVISNGSILGEATAESLDITTGNNTNVKVSAVWNPSKGGDRAIKIGRDLISQYLSGYNTTVTIRTYEGSIPTLPKLGNALSRLNFTLAAPRLSLPGDEDRDDEDKAHFVRDAVFHVFSSTATFTLVSPLEKNTMYVDHVNATAYYNHTEPLGVITYDFPFACPPGASMTPKLPVEWSLDSVGYEKLKNALGGTLKLDARAEVGVRLGAWKETLWYVGKGIGASVKL